jgi:hypothetical protein
MCQSSSLIIAKWAEGDFDNFFISLNTDLRFARPKIRGWEAQNEGLMKTGRRAASYPGALNNYNT